MDIQLHKRKREFIDKVDKVYDNFKKDCEKINELAEPKEIIKKINECKLRYDNRWNYLESLYQSYKLQGVVPKIGKTEFILHRNNEFTKIKKKHNLLPKEDQYTYQNPSENKRGNSYRAFIEKKTQKEDNEENSWTCAECFKDKTGAYLIFEEKNDGNKLCSEKCFRKYYGEICNNCFKECLIFYRDKNYSDIIYCSECWKKNQLKELEQESDLTIYCRYCSAKTDSIFDVCDKEECLEKMNKEIEDKKDNNIREREREREREQNLLAYFTTHSIQSIRLDNNKLLIKYNHKEEEEEANTPELEQIKDYLENIPDKIITKSELESKSKQDSSNPLSNGGKDSNTALYWGIGIVGILFASLLIVFARIRKRNKKY